MQAHACPLAPFNRGALEGVAAPDENAPHAGPCAVQCSGGRRRAASPSPGMDSRGCQGLGGGCPTRHPSAHWGLGPSAQSCQRLSISFCTQSSASRKAADLTYLDHPRAVVSVTPHHQNNVPLGERCERTARPTTNRWLSGSGSPSNFCFCRSQPRGAILNVVQQRRASGPSLVRGAVRGHYRHVCPATVPVLRNLRYLFLTAVA